MNNNFLLVGNRVNDQGGKYMLRVGRDYIYKSSDFGVNWYGIDAEVTGYQWYDCSISATGQYQIVVSNNPMRFIVSNDYGETWTLWDYMGGTAESVISVNGQKMFIPINGADRMYYSSNYGVSWTTLTNYASLIYVSASARYQLKKLGTMWYVSSDYGSTWSTGFADGMTEGCVSPSGKYMTLIGNNNYNIMVSSDYGVNWVSKTSPSYLTASMGPKQLCMSVDGKYQVIGSAGKFIESYDYGATWSSRQPSYTLWYSLCISDYGKRMAMCYYSGTSYLSKDFGKTFTFINHYQIYDFAMNRPSSLLFI